jgi:alpha-L-fucosidase 2
MSIRSAFSPKEGRWIRQWPESVSQHDVVYLSPPIDPIQGMPIGNGELGALLWTEGGRLLIAVNHCGLWDDGPAGEFDNWAKVEYERQTCLRHACRIEVDFHTPAFDPMYLEEFDGRIALASAQAAMHSKTPFSDVRVTAFASHLSKIIAIHCEAETKEEIATDIEVERWGSRTYKAYSGRSKRDATLGTSGTETSVSDGMLRIDQKLRTLDFSVGVRVAEESAVVGRLHSRAGAFSFSARRTRKFTIYIAVATSEETADPKQEVETLLRDACAEGEARIAREHADAWRGFWQESFLSIPESYMENLWHLVLYFANSSMRGAFPPHFTSGLWGFQRDFVPWTFYFHWNMQKQIDPLHAANHAELSMPYLRFRRHQLDHAVDYAARVQNRRGAFYADVSDRNGYNDIETKHNQAPGPQIAMDFWKHYQYTGDEAFLREMAWPVIRETARYCTELFQPDEGGTYHCHATQAYEGGPLLDDAVTDVAMAKALFPVAIEVAEIIGFTDPDVQLWKRIAVNLTDFTLVGLRDGEFRNQDGREVLAGGLGEGTTPRTKLAISAGFYSDDQKVSVLEPGTWIRNRTLDREGYYGIPDPEFCPVFPAGVVGLSRPSAPLFQAAVNQVLIHPYTEPGRPVVLPCMGWCPAPIVAARLGLRDGTVRAIGDVVSEWQCYINGFGHYGGYEVYKKENDLRWNTSPIVDVDTGDTVPAYTWPYRHFDNEAMPIVATALNEMLLQSYDGAVRLFPATPEAWSASFRLACTGGFVADAELQEGKVAWVCLDSRLGKTCRLVAPWGGDASCLELDASGESLGSIAPKTVAWGEDVALEFPTTAGHRYLLTREPIVLDDWVVVPTSYETNGESRKLGDASLGLPRMF